MLAALLIPLLLAAALLAVATIAASLAKGIAAVSLLRRRLADASDSRAVTIRHERLVRVRQVATVRAARRPSRPVPVLAPPAPRRVAA